MAARGWAALLAGMAVAVPTAAALDGETTGEPVEDRLRAVLAHEREQHRVGLGQAETRRLRQVRGLRRTLFHRPHVLHAIRLASVSTGVPYRTLFNVAKCESRFRPRVVNDTPIYNGEHAQGLYQFIPSTWRGQTRQGRAGLSIFDPYANAMGAAQLIAHDGLRQWHCNADGIAP